MRSLKVTLHDREVLLQHLLDCGIDIAHDCGGVLGCASCRVVIREGLDGFESASSEELDMLERAEALQPDVRLACQVRGAGELLIDVPREVQAPAAGALLPVAVTPSAARHFAAQMLKHPTAAVRLAVRTSGCSGLRYRVYADHELRDGDRIFEIGGVRVVVDSASLPFVQGTTIDVVNDGLSTHLSFNNPNARSSCGCGESFGV